MQKKASLLSEDASQDASEAAHAVAAAFRLGATQDHAQHASQAGGIDAIAFLALAQKGEQARGDGSQDAAHRVGAYAF